MLATELLFACIYCLVDDAIRTGVLLIPRRPGPAPDCTDAELLCIALARHLPGCCSENGFPAQIRRDWPGLFPHLPDQPEVNRRTRWLRGALEQPPMSARSAPAWSPATPPAPARCHRTRDSPAAASPTRWPAPGSR